MSSCNAANFLYDLVPLKSWRALLIRIHFERCRRCQSELAGAAEARSLFVQETDTRLKPALWEGISRSLVERDAQTAEKPWRPSSRRLWRWAAAAAVLVVLAGYWAWRDFRPAGVPMGAAAPARFELEYVRVGGQPADAYVYQPQGSDIIIVWAGRNQ